ncbi:hypothetical protein BH10BAC2_BH10BAC2_35070 [soil metagenome]
MQQNGQEVQESDTTKHHSNSTTGHITILPLELGQKTNAAVGGCIRFFVRSGNKQTILIIRN